MLQDQVRVAMMRSQRTFDGGYARVHDTAILDGMIVLSNGVEIGPYAFLWGAISIGPRTKIGAHVVIGTDGEHRSEPANVGQIIIGEDVVIREFSAVQRGTGDRETTIGARTWIMDNGHVAHDVVIAEDVTLSPNVVLGGHTRVHRGATLGIGAMTHQHSTIGAYSMVGMGSVVTRDVPPFALVIGNPARYMRENTKGRDLWAAKLAGGADPNEPTVNFSEDSRRPTIVSATLRIS